jgi:hypothetical protein
MGTFIQRMDHLSEEVGTGSLVARCKVNQPYAQDQHETLHYRHNDGRARYLGGPLFENQADLMDIIGRHAITPLGSDIQQGMIEVAEMMARYVLTNAPKLSGRLSTSGHPTVTDNGMLIYDRPPISPRELD